MKTKNLIIGLGILCLNAVAYAQGLQGIVVEKYYSTDAADGANALAEGSITTLNTGTTVYRVYVDMAAGYKYSQIFGSNANNLKVNTTTNFFNDPNYGVTINPGTVSVNNIKKYTMMIDSWFTTGGVAVGKVGVLKSEDTDGSLGNTQGILANNAGGCFGLPINGSGAQDGFVAGTTSTYLVPNALGLGSSLDCLEGSTPGNSITITNGAIAALGGIVGATSSNMVLIGQFTTDGVFTFELNLQLVNIATGLAENYVASNPTGSYLTHPSLTRGSNLAPVVLCYQTATYNNQTCTYDITGTQPVQPTTACYQTATFNSITCAWVLTGTQAEAPTGLSCWQTAAFNSSTCAWVVSGTQPVQPTLACYETGATFNTTSCQWDVTGTQPEQPTLACYQTAAFDTTSCAWFVSGTQEAQPTGLSCWQTASFNPISCAWDVSGTQAVQPILACYQTAIFNTSSCAWDVSGNQAAEPSGLACYQSATFDTTTCSWVVSGTQQINAATISACGSYTWLNNGQIYTASGIYFGDTVNCIIQKLILTITAVSSADISYLNSAFCNAETNLQLVSLVGSSGGIYGAIPAGLSLDINSGSISPSASSPGNYIVTYTTQASGSCNSVYDTAFIIISEVPEEPTGLACWQSADLISSSCSWYISGTQPVQPILACYEEAVFSTATCSWVVTGTQPLEPTNLSCWQTASFNTTSCSWDVSGTQAPEPSNLLCWQTAAFSTLTCSWDITGTQAPEPTGLSCWQTAAFNTTSCSWDVSGTQAPEPTNLSCWQTAVFNSTSCSWDVSGELQENIVNIDALDSYTWMVNGQTYTSSGTYEFLDTINCVLEILNLALTNSISEELTNNLSIYPNPTNGTIVISLPKNDQYTFNLYDSQGKLVFEDTALANSIVHDLSSYRPGLYIFKVALSDVIYIERVIKN